MIQKTITLEDMQKASDYIPIMEKDKFVEDAAIGCMKTLKIYANYSEDDQKPLPNMYKEDTFRKSRYLMWALLTGYFHFEVETEEGDERLITVEEYDNYLGSHIFDQIQQFKTSKDSKIKDKAYQILADYKDLETRLAKDIQGNLTAMNDPVARAQMALTQSMNVDPNDMEKLIGKLESNKKMFEEYVANKGTGDTSAGA